MVSKISLQAYRISHVMLISFLRITARKITVVLLDGYISVSIIQGNNPLNIRAGTPWIQQWVVKPLKQRQLPKPNIQVINQQRTLKETFYGLKLKYI